MTGRSDIPRVTIAITSYNAAATIGRAIDSALAQNWPEFEVIVADDASSDDSVRVIAAYGDRVRLIVNESNMGVAATSNRILDAAEGDFVAFFDDDDESAPSRLARQVEAITAYEAANKADLVACFAAGERVYPNGYALRLRPPGLDGISPQGAAMADYLLYFERRRHVGYGGTPACSMMARRRVFTRLGGFDPALRRVQDIDFCIRLALAGGHFIGCAGDLVRQYATTGGDKSADAEATSWETLLSKHADYLRSRGVYGYALAWARFRRAYFAGRHGAAAYAFAGLVLRHPIRGVRQFLATGLARLRHDRRRIA